MNEGRISPQNLGGDISAGRIQNPNQNLIDKVKLINPFLKPEFYKPLVLELAGLLAAYWSGWEYVALRSGGGNVGRMFFAFLVFATAITLQFFLIKKFLRSVVDAMLTTAVFLIPFAADGLQVLSVAGGVNIAFMLLGWTSIHTELQNNMEVRFFRTARSGLTKFATGLTLLVLILYIPQWKQGDIFISKNIFGGLYGVTSNSLKAVYPSVDTQSTFIAFTRGIARAKVQSDPNLRYLPEEQEKAIAQISKQIGETIQAQTGVLIADDELTENVAYKIIVAYLANMNLYFGDWFLVVWGALLFFFLRGAAVGFYWIAMLISFILYKLLVAVGFVRIVGIQKTQEIIEI